MLEANGVRFSQLQLSPTVRNSKCSPKVVGDGSYGRRGYDNNHFASPSVRGFESWSSLDVFVALGPLCTSCACLHPAHPAGPRATCPGTSEAPQMRMPEHSSLGAPGQSLAVTSAAVLTQTLGLQGRAAWQTQQQQPARKPPPSHPANLFYLLRKTEG